MVFSEFFCIWFIITFIRQFNFIVFFVENKFPKTATTNNIATCFLKLV